MLRAISLAIALGVLGFGLVVWWLGEDLGSALRVPPWAYAAGLGLLVLNYAAGTVRFKVLARLESEPLTWLAALRAYALGLFAASITPGSSGQAPAMVTSLAYDGMAAPRAWSIAIAVWITDLLVLAFTVPSSILIVSSVTKVLGAYYPGLVAAFLFLLALLAIWLLVYRVRWIAAVADKLLALRWLRRWRKPTVMFIERLDESGKEFWAAPAWAQVLVHFCTVIVYLSTYFTFYVVVASLRPHAPVLSTTAAAQVSLVAAAWFPTPGGAGALELVTATLIRGGQTAAAILAWRILTFYSRMVIGPALGAPVLASLGSIFGKQGDERP